MSEACLKRLNKEAIEAWLNARISTAIARHEELKSRTGMAATIEMGLNNGRMEMLKDFQDLYNAGVFYEKS